MSTYNKFISNMKAVPVISSNLFEKADNKRFASIMLGFGSKPKEVDQNIFLSYLTLRKNVYVDQTGILEASEYLNSSVESDEYDSHSAHIAVFENCGDGKVATIGCLRLIVKTTDTLLPIEEFYPEIFKLKPISIGDIEMSRFISRAEKGKGDNFKIIMSLFHVGLCFAIQNNTQLAYGVIETQLEKAMQSFSSASRKIGNLKMIDKYNTENIALEIDLKKARHDMELQGFSFIEIEPNKPIFWGKR